MIGGWDWNEWHTFWIGFCECACFRQPKIPCPDKTSKEYHYYGVGRFAGNVVLLIEILVFSKLFESWIVNSVSW